MKKVPLIFCFMAVGAMLTAHATPNPKDLLVSQPDSGKSQQTFSKLHPMGGFPGLIEKNIAKEQNPQIEAWLATPIRSANSGLNAQTGGVEMVVFGGGLSAGVSNGGLTRQSQQASYANLLAHQMGAGNFAMPLFDKEQYNGTGYYVYERSVSEYPKWTRVTNNTIAQANSLPTYEGKVSNFAFPNGSSMWFVRGQNCEDCDVQRMFLSRFDKFLDQQPARAFNKIKDQTPYDFVIIEDFFDRWMLGINRISQFGIYDENFNGSILNTGKITDYSINQVLDKGQKGVIFTIPRYQDLPYMNWYSTDDLRKKSSQIKITYNRNNEKVELDATKSFYLIPSEKVDALFTNLKEGDVFEANFDDIEIIDYEESFISDPENHYNQKIKEFAEKRGLAVVDLCAIYKSIREGNYKSDDGFQIDGSTFGNFFSSDGIYPTALGQAVIANEVIKSINKKYSSQIPLINISAFSKTVGF